MPQLSRPCPHCHSEKIGFSPRSIIPTVPGKSESLVFLQCEGCGQAIVLVVGANASTLQQWANGVGTFPPAIKDEYPKQINRGAPADVPKPVETSFLSGLDNLSRPNGANAAAIMFRRSIEVAVKLVNSEGKGDLKTRIAKLPDSVATPAMKDWADHIRLDGNDAAHDVEDYSTDDAKQLYIFAEMFLTYAFTLPAMLKRARQLDEALK